MALRTLILDFDRTLFDTDRAKAAWGNRLSELVASERPFADDELASFIFPDARRFLEAWAGQMALWLISSLGERTSGAPTSLSFQQAKIAASGIAQYFDHVEVIEGLKGPVIADRLGSAIEGAVLIDDSRAHLASMEAVGGQAVLLDRFAAVPGALANFDGLPGLLAGRESVTV